MRKLLTTTLCAVFVPLAAFSQCSNIKLSADKRIQCAPGIVNFMVTGAPGGSSYLWDFGKGFVANTDTVYEFFINPQTVNVQVKVSFPDGTQCAVAENSIVQILGKPLLSYSISRRKLCDGPDTVTLINTTPNTQQISWVVDGTNYFNASNTLIHQFKTTGIKDINLVVTDSFGCRDVKEFKNVAVVHPDVALNFVADNTSGCVTKNVQLAASVGSNGETITQTEWLLPGSDRAFASGMVPPSVRYINPGGYDVSFSVKTANGCIHALKKEKYLNFGDSIKIDLVIKDSILCLKNKTEVSVSNPIQNAKYIWSFSGLPDTTHISKTNVELLYPTAGEYAVELLLNYAGCVSRVSVASAIKVKTLDANFTSIDNFHCYTPHYTHITNSSTSYKNVPLDYKWTITGFDGTTLSTSTDSNLIYASPDWGRYTVELIAKDPYGCKDTFKIKQFIRVDSIRPTITSPERIGCVNQNIKLTSITPASSYLSPDSFYWIVYDLDGNTIYNKGQGRNIEQSFDKPGYYNVTLYAGNLIGCIDSLPSKNYIHIIEPKKSFEIVDSAICAGQEVVINATTTPKHAPFLHSWRITHDTKGTVYNLALDTGLNRRLTLTDPGAYTVQYNHQISGGCKDSITSPAMLHVNGVSGAIKLDQNDGCLPFFVKPTYEIAQNLHYGSTSDSLKYQWSVSPTSNVEILNPQSARPTFIFKSRDVYRIYITVTNSADCFHSISSELVYAGVKAAFNVPNDSVCALDSIPLNNTSSLNPTSFTWNINSTGKHSLRQNVTPNRIVFEDDALYEISLIASKSDLCFDTATLMVRSIVVKSAFEMADTHLFCAPAYAQFNTLSENADTFFWNFGDGSTITTTDEFIANIYHRNTGFKDGFNVSLTSKSYLGCSDELTIENAIKVFGPVPDFQIKNFVGCEPLQVELINKSLNASEYYLNYDDNTPLDSTNFQWHTYKVQTTGMSQKYLPSLYVKDSLGCAAAIESKDTVHVLKSPIAIPSDKEIEGCSPVQVALTDESSNITSRSWLLNDVEISTSISVSPSISIPGNHVLSLVVTNENNCSDTSEFKIKVNENPVAELIHLDDVPCNNQVARFHSTAHSKAGILEHKWYFNNGTTDTIFALDFDYLFTKIGRNNIQYEVTDINGCSDVLDTFVDIRSVEQIPDGNVKFVSIENNNEIEIHWGNINPDFIAFTTIVDNNSKQTVYQNSPNLDSMISVPYSDIKTSRCFNMVNVNLCGESGLASTPHCPVILSVAKGNAFQLDLSWTAYSGWDIIDRYIIQRSDDGIDFNPIAEVNGSTLFYTDTALCDMEYSYRIVAQNNTLSSRSNYEANRPNYSLNAIPMDIKVATVLDNKNVQVEWEPSLFQYAHSYMVYKHDVTGTKLIETKLMNATTFVDSMVDVNREHFKYSVHTVDHCNVSGIKGNIGLPIIMDGFYANDMSNLSWTAYDQWEDGVDFYQIQLYSDGVFNTIAQVPGSQTAYVDKEGHEEIDGQYLFRIVAVSFNASVKSISNEVTLIGSSLMWIPNAFSPNDDDHNPVFKPSAQFMYLLQDGSYRDYEMKIYNRWGEDLFTTNDIKEGWDGSYKGKDCEMESYLYHIRITGLDRVIYDKKGLVRLMR